MSDQNHEQLNKIRHSYAHILAAAVSELYPNVKFAIGPVIENGFYYDFDFGEEKFSEEDLAQVEKKMKHLIKQNPDFKNYTMEAEEAMAKEEQKGQIYKQELIRDLKQEGESQVSYYQVGSFEDLCRGPHVESAKELNPKAFKLTSVAGAYWKGDENNKMLTRIYGVGFRDAESLNEHLRLVEEAKKRDHRKLGKELDLFCFSDLVGPGLPMFTPRGAFIKEKLQERMENICRGYGFEKVITPHLAKIDLYKLSGHADKFGEELFHVTSKHNQEYVMKPVQCPHQTQIYASRTRSYRDLPIRYMESEKQYRAEKPGEIGGLNRVIAITVEDGHSFCRVDQVKDEIKNLVNIIKEFYTSLGLWGNHWVSLSLRDYDDPSKYIGSREDWDTCERMLEEISKEMELDARKCEGEAALYGPKLDFMFRDSLGKEIQIPTVQLDFATPKKFNLTFVNQQGKEENPVMVHRAILGSYERFLALLIEHFGGAFPVWLAPEQVRIISVGSDHADYCRKLKQEIKNHDLRAETDIGDDTVNYKIKKAVKEKIPYILVVGDKEMNSGILTVRDRGSEQTREVDKEDFIKEIKE
jgi:threonyl-tRNA synthetase